MHADDLLYAMRSGAEQSPQAIAAFVTGVCDGSVSRPQAAAWLAYAFQRGLTDAETIALTGEMTRSGDVLDWGEGAPCVDKHSTGGVGDKVSLVLAPLLVELGYRVPMVSGRGLGHTGGTLDKLEAIDGFRCDLSEEELREVLSEVGCFISGQTRELAPADRILYGLRNETCTVESIPLIVGSILSKKLAEGIERLVLDVKTGSGAFMKTFEDSHRLAEALVRVTEGNGVRCTALITAMDRPLGHAVGNALEVAEAMESLKGGGPEDLRRITVELAQDERAAEFLASGRCYETFCRMARAQGGNPDHLLGEGTTELVVESPRDGFVTAVDALSIGRAAFVLGARRRRAEDPVDPGVGIEALAKPGQQVSKGQVLARIHHRGREVEQSTALVRGAISVGDAAAEVSALIQATVTV